jgi:predicted ATPase/DNA-binding CsgD family transcriptional regulator/DNA-binding XRE family transcriptional regulator
VAGQPALSFAALLRQLRAEAWLTQEELAEAARLSPRSVSDLERGINRTARKDTAVLLADALSLSGRTRELFIAVARGRAPAAEVLAAARGDAGGASPVAVGGAHGFPRALTSFIGRSEVVREVTGLVNQYRLVTVTGPGGAGKTRLVGEVAERVSGRFADGVRLVELAAVRDSAQVASVVATSLGVREQPGVPAEEALARVLARQQLLLVLDNCEHVIGAAAHLCAGLLVTCDDVRVLATSREPLAVAGEARYRLAPLSLPDEDGEADAGGSEAVALFADRARRADARFTLDRESGPAVGRLVTRLDGMPLAIELAAARVEALGVAQLLDRIDDRFALLAGGDRLAAGRHRSLAATVEWSYQLLDDRERRLFRRLSVFPGPFTLEAAEAVAGAGAGSAVLHLVDCSLLSPPQTGPDSRSRYAMLETLRAYGAALLAEAGEHEGAAAALARYAVVMAEQAAAGLQTSTAAEVAAARWLDAEDATIRQVLAWAMDHDPATAVRLAAALGWWWLLRGRLPGQYALLREAAGCSEPGSDSWCAAQLWLILAALFCSDPAGTLEHATALRDAVAGRGPSRALADGLRERALALVNLGRAAEAAGDARQALAVAREIGYPAGEVSALGILSFTAGLSDDMDGAVHLARQAAQITVGVPGSLVRWCSYVLTGALINAGDLAAADEVCAAGLARAREAADVHSRWCLLPHMVTLDLHVGRVQDAAAHLREGIQIAVRTGGWIELVNCLDGCGHLCAATGRPAEAVTIWAALAVLLGHDGGADAPADMRRRTEPLRAARQALGPDRARAAEDRGAAMNLAAAAEYALILTAPSSQQAPPPGLPDLSARERELVSLVARGRTDAQIAAQLHISVRTVRTHLDRIRDKTGYRRRADLTRLALQASLA